MLFTASEPLWIEHAEVGGVYSGFILVNNERKNIYHVVFRFEPIRVGDEGLDFARRFTQRGFLRDVAVEAFTQTHTLNAHVYPANETSADLSATYRLYHVVPQPQAGTALSKVGNLGHQRLAHFIPGEAMQPMGTRFVISEM